ncbi:MAG: 1-acyl-sn-glycerol-3-phosphate acyltransferase [Bacteroidales bacterium]|jgi:1-acyl-sn-glycerol-3-phosphate acyltransferase
MSFKSKFASFILKLFRWEIKGMEQYGNVKKAVLIMVPHTSNMDFVIGKLVLTKHNKKCLFFIKKEAFDWFLIGPILKKLGGIPINRNQHNNHIKKTVKILNEQDNIWIAITPEGTRKKVERWKKGFYIIAMEAKVPILISYIDYKTKNATIADIFYPTGDYQSDLIKIKEHYIGVSGRNR